MKIIILCGGIGSRMKDYSMPKPLNMIYGKHAISYVLENIPSEVNELIFIYGIHLKQYNFEEIIINLFKDKKCIFYCVEYLTRGPVETAYIGTQYLKTDSNESIVFLDNDNIYSFPDNFFVNKDYNFLGISNDTTGWTQYSFVQHTNYDVFNIVEKQRISNQYCCGVYGFKNIEIFHEAARKLLTTESNFSNTNELYMSDIFRFLLHKKHTVRAIEFNNKCEHIGSLGELQQSLHSIIPTKMRICFDLDNTLVSYPTVPGDYNTVKPIKKTIELAQKLHSEGHTIIIYTARRMTTHKNNVGAVIKDIGLITFNTLEKFNIPYDELIFGKPIADIYIDDRSVNPCRNDYPYMGIFDNISDDTIVNKLPTNIHNKITLVNTHILKEGPKQFINGEYFVYSQLYKFQDIREYFPECYSFNEEIDKCKLEIEYIKGIPLYYLFKNNLMHKEMISEIINIVGRFHNCGSKTYNITLKDIENNYILKLIKRFEVNTDYTFPDSVDIQNIVLNRLTEYASSNRVKIVPFIHGDLWFSNIIYTFDKKYKCFDMKGQVNNILTTNGDPLYDYAKLYQSLLGFDIVLWEDYSLYDEHKKELCKFYEEQIEKLGISLYDLQTVVLGLIIGTLHAMNDERKIRVWNFIKSILDIKQQK